jgi:hypothetical protein
MLSATQLAPWRQVLQVGDINSTSRRWPTSASNRAARAATALTGGLELSDDVVAVRVVHAETTTTKSRIARAGW